MGNPGEFVDDELGKGVSGCFWPFFGDTKPFWNLNPGKL
jgi:hypothetical protein